MKEPQTNKKSFILYKDNYELWKALSDEDAGKLIKTIFAYVSGEEVNATGYVNLAFLAIKPNLIRDLEKWEKVCSRNKINGSKGGRRKEPKEPSGLSGNPKEPKQPDNDNVNDNVNENVNVKEKIKDAFSESFKQVESEWNNFAEENGLVKIIKLNEKRKKHLTTRFGEKEFCLQDILNKAKGSPFLLGTNNRKWKITLDWLIENNTNYIKVLEGKYIQDTPAPKPPEEPMYRKFED